MRISNKYGLNPTLPVCFWCGKETGTVALLGHLPGDKEAPHKCVMSYEPCEDCAKKFAEGIHIFAGRAPSNDKERSIAYRGAIPLGPHVVMTREGFAKMCTGPEAEEALRVGGCIIPPELFNMIFNSE